MGTTRDVAAPCAVDAMGPYRHEAFFYDTPSSSCEAAPAS
jgi:hypothetical protein